MDNSNKGKISKKKVQISILQEQCEGRLLPKRFPMHDIKLWPCGIERPNSNSRKLHLF